MEALTFPCSLFKTQKKMDDYDASDMRCGDLTETQLKREFQLVDVSTRVDPYTLTTLSPFSLPQSMFQGSHRPGQKIMPQACARILFAEFRHLAQAFALFGPYRRVIDEMITHMEGNSGFPFESVYLNCALKQHIVNDNDIENSTFLKIQDALSKHIDWENGCFPSELKYKLEESIQRGRLPKFDRLQDSFNGLGIAVHDTWATHITLTSLHIGEKSYRARVHYRVQDHFGLDCEDIQNILFSNFRLFRIWFVLQRYHRFGFKPFITNINADIEITGERNDNK
ncbi:hypothetical protein B1H58_17115 [Pantoea alhagi]|uniref:DUF3289 domain-containing protein n=1 Tax=Pantoea alhagi TaxID=1891675 RepID=A0A1W6B921_9GAMM|nr:DUF3289 family protein [Pantoea alhagi]ARJ43592.1 hypothetical protein B1H58_17115 [Pantoea alhagi]